LNNVGKNLMKSSSCVVVRKSSYPTVIHQNVSLQTEWRTNNKGDVGIYILYERMPVQELSITRLAYRSTSPVQFIIFI